MRVGQRVREGEAQAQDFVGVPAWKARARPGTRAIWD